MTRHQVGKLYVGIFEGTGKKSKALKAVPRDVAASLNTHDLPPFVTHYTGADVPERISAGVFNPELESGELKNRERDRAALSAWLKSRGATRSKDPDAASVGLALYRYLAESDAELTLVNIEDLWGETRWQNIPGTTTEHANWRHKLRRTLVEIRNDEALSEALRDLAARRLGERGVESVSGGGARSRREPQRKRTSKASRSRA